MGYSQFRRFNTQSIMRNLEQTSVLDIPPLKSGYRNGTASMSFGAPKAFSLPAPKHRKMISRSTKPLRTQYPLRRKAGPLPRMRLSNSTGRLYERAGPPIRFIHHSRRAERTWCNGQAPIDTIVYETGIAELQLTLLAQ